MTQTRIVSVVGARPQFIKLAPVCRAIAEHNAGATHRIDNLILHTGQHYDAGMSSTFFDELEIPKAEVNLGVGSGPHGTQTARMLEGVESVLLDRRPALVIVYGDTNSTIAGALAASKLQIEIAHVEAGLRSFNRRMPEEINRVATDHISDLLLAPTPTAERNLHAERLGDRALFTGDVMYDAVLHARDRARQRSQVLSRLELPSSGYGIVTLHRAENTAVEQLRSLLPVLNEVAANYLPLVFPIHPRTQHIVQAQLGSWRPASALRLVEPVGYLDMLRLLDEARLVLTDSGGLQKEAYFLGCPCITLRTETEWLETVAAGGNIVVGTSRTRIIDAVRHWLEAPARPRFAAASSNPFGDGHAAQRILAALCSALF
jgi:UDP-N-acetylglucosamine 2-epimerase